MSTLSSDLHIQCHTSKSQCHFIAKIDKSILKFIRNLKTPQILPPKKMKEKKKVEGLIFSDFKMYFKAMVTKPVWYWHKNRQIEKLNRMESSEINPCIYGQIVFGKAAKTT